MRKICFLAFFILSCCWANLQAQASQTYSAPGTYTFTVPAGVYTVSVQCWGGGGGGSDRENGIDNADGGGGGGGGGFAGGLLNVTPGDDIDITVGGGGDGGGMGGDPGLSGDASSAVHTLTSATITADGGFGGTAMDGGSTGGDGGSGSFAGMVINQVTYNGGKGGNGDAIRSGGGGGGAGDSENGGDGGQPGGGTGGNANGGDGGIGSINASPGAPGNAYGGGGGGASNNDASIGGNGAAGAVVISWGTYYSGGETITNTYTSDDMFNVPEGVTSVVAQAWGAGGGGSDSGTNGPREGGGGGGGGAFASGTLSVSTNDDITISVGAGGGGGTGDGDNGENGMESSASHTSGTITAGGGIGGTAQDGGGIGGDGGTASFSGSVADQLSHTGGKGADGDTNDGGGGGGGAGSTQDGDDGMGTSGGGGGNNGGGDGGDGSTDTNAAEPGIEFGGGGGGSSDFQQSQGGAGANGQVIVSYTCPYLTLASGAGTDVQIIDNSLLTSITYEVGGSVSNVDVTGLPTGVLYTYLSGTLTISGIPLLTGDFNFTATADGGGAACATASLSGSIEVITILPIELTAFNGQQKGLAIELGWKTATEKDNDYMAIERSADGRSFEEIGRVPGAGTTPEPQAYHFTDTKPLNGLSYYRLRQVDFDGASEYHGPISVAFNGKGLGIGLTAFPNPASEMLYATWAAPAGQPATLQVLDMTGRQLAQYAAPAGTSSFELPLKNLPAGLYFLEVRQGDEVEVLRFRRE
ncbi:MAG: T9SS type A sorting domain-containing protein [Lewinellaceae bacterium]|nr:T9SS type A sorting domain-containing protein [Lewinellaceae bacterium]